jgi:hypothetical protein
VNSGGSSRLSVGFCRGLAAIETLRAQEGIRYKRDCGLWRLSIRVYISLVNRFQSTKGAKYL